MALAAHRIPHSAILGCSKRRLATAVPLPASHVAGDVPAPNPKTNYPRNPVKGKLGAKRPTWDMPVNPKHGLWGFFRRKEIEDSKDPKAPPKLRYVTVEASDPEKDSSGRAWTVAELRRKAFVDLHIIWYQCQRELNLLSTQEAAMKKLHLDRSDVPTVPHRMVMCRKTCARIKYVLNERRLAFENARDRIRWDNRPGYKDEAKNPYAAEQAQLARKTKREQVVQGYITKLKTRRLARIKAMAEARAAKLKALSSASSSSANDTAAPATSTVDLTLNSQQLEGQEIKIPTLDEIKIKRSSYHYPPVGGMSRKDINRRLHRIAKRKELHPVIKKRVMLTIRHTITRGRGFPIGHKWNRLLEQ